MGDRKGRDGGQLARAAAMGELLFQHTVLCQTSLPYRDPGDGVRSWERRNGKIHLKVSAGEAFHPGHEEFVPLGLPFGTKPRLLLAYLNAEAMRTGSPLIEVEDSLSAFVRRLRLDSHGRNIGTIKDQLARLSAATILLGVAFNGDSVTIKSDIVSAFSLWFPKDDRQRVMWPSTVRLSDIYFNSLSEHAVPLDEAAVHALAHSAMGLDIYAWLAQRLHRIEPGKPAFVPWVALQEQFGWHYGRVRDFRRVFEHTLRRVHAQYPRARFDLDERGVTLWHSPPPVERRGVVVVVAGEP
jgi:Plasmid encoded RepA protein